MKVRKEYRVCDRCEDKINERWYRLANITSFKRRLIVGGHVIDRGFDLCGKCTEKFDRFMEGSLNDDKPTEYEECLQVRQHSSTKIRE